MQENAFPFGADLRSPDRTGNLGIEHLDMPAVGITDQGRNLFGVIRPAVHHGQQDTLDPQLRIDLPLHLIDRLEQLFQPLCGKVIGLHRDQRGVRRCQRIDGQHPQARHTVQKHIVIILLDRFQELFQNPFPVHRVDQRHLKTGKRDVCRNQVDAFLLVKNPFRRLYRVFIDRLVQEIKQRGLQIIRSGVSKADRQRSLRISVHQEHFLSFPCKPDSEVLHRRRFRRAAFLVDDTDHCWFVLHTSSYSFQPYKSWLTFV